jgi:hypothetical protein
MAGARGSHLSRVSENQFEEAGSGSASQGADSGSASQETGAAARLQIRVRTHLRYGRRKDTLLLPQIDHGLESD